MKSWRIPLALVLGWATLGQAAAYAQIGQYQRPIVNPRPTVSPYLNIFRGNNPAINYFGVVRPQLEMNRALQTLQTEVQTLQPAPLMPSVPVDQQPFAGMPTTGHPISWYNTTHFFPTPGARSGGSPVAGGTGGPVGYSNPGAMPRGTFALPR